MLREAVVVVIGAIVAVAVMLIWAIAFGPECIGEGHERWSSAWQECVGYKAGRAVREAFIQ